MLPSELPVPPLGGGLLVIRFLSFFLMFVTVISDIAHSFGPKKSLLYSNDLRRLCVISQFIFLGLEILIPCSECLICILVFIGDILSANARVAHAVTAVETKTTRPIERS